MCTRKTEQIKFTGKCWINSFALFLARKTTSCTNYNLEPNPKETKKIINNYRILFFIFGKIVSADYNIGNLNAIFMQPQPYCIQWADVTIVKPVDCYIFPHDYKRKRTKNGIKNKQKRLRLCMNACATHVFYPKWKSYNFSDLGLICGRSEKDTDFPVGRNWNWFFTYTSKIEEKSNGPRC